MKNNILGYNFFLLFLLSSIWGSAFLAIKISVESVNPVTIASSRLLIGALFLFLSPRIFAESFYSQKDILFMSMFIINIYYAFHFLKLSNPLFYLIKSYYKSSILPLIAMI